MMLIGNLPFEEVNPAEYFPKIQEKLDELRAFKIKDGIIELLEEQSKVLVGLMDGDKCASIAYVYSEMEKWKGENPFWFGHLA